MWEAGCKGRTFGDYTNFFMGCLEEEPKVGKGLDFSGLGRGKYGKIEE